VSNLDSGDVTVIDGFTNATSTVSVGYTPKQLVVDPLTHLVYVPNYESNTVSVIRTPRCDDSRDWEYHDDHFCGPHGDR
jgi:YVTN family beta-propeller protein